MKNCLIKVRDVNADREPPFPFFKFLFSCMRLCVCACLFILFISPFLLSLSLSLTDYLSLLRFFILFLYWFCSFCWKSEDSKYWKFRKRELEKKTRNQHKKRSKQRKNKTVTWPTTVITTNTIGISMRSTV